MYFNAIVNVTDEQYLRTYNVMRLGDIAFEGHSNKEFSHGRFVENYIGDGIVSHIFTVLRPRVPFDVNYWRYAINNEKLMRLSLIRSTKASTMMHDLVPSDFLRSNPNANSCRTKGNRSIPCRSRPSHHPSSVTARRQCERQLFLAKTKNRRFDIAKSAVLRLEIRSNSR